MEVQEKKVWGIHTDDDALFKNENVIAIGWRKMGDLKLLPDNRYAFKSKYAEVFPEATKQSIANCAGMLYRFAKEVEIDDFVIYPSRNDRMINLGVVEGEYVFNTQAKYCHQRRVKWLKHLPRTAFSQGALYEIGSAMTFFAVRNYTDEYLKAINSNYNGKAGNTISEDDESVGVTADSIIESTKDFILKELSRNLKGYDLEEFVADLLQAMGYRTEVSPHGGDRGIDITAYKDELPPRILVQVKSQDGDIKEATIQSLKGAMKEGDYGLFVTLSNYTKNALSYLNNTPIIRGINGTELVDLILKYYDKLSEKYRKMIPLKMVYIPIADLQEE